MSRKPKVDTHQIKADFARELGELLYKYDVYSVKSITYKENQFDEWCDILCNDGNIKKAPCTCSMPTMMLGDILFVLRGEEYGQISRKVNRHL